MDHIPSAHRIPRISSKAARLFFDEFYLPAKPVIITGLVREWPASGSISVTTQRCPLLSG